jgi:hypothetical protein
LFWGKALIQTQTISKKLDDNGKWTTGLWETGGSYRILEIYEPTYQKMFTKMESPAGKSIFE